MVLRTFHSNFTFYSTFHISSHEKNIKNKQLSSQKAKYQKKLNLNDNIN